MMEKKDKDEFKYTIKDVPWYVWLCFAISIFFLLLIIFFTPPKFDIVAGTFSIMGFFLALLLLGFDYTNRTVVKKMDEHFEKMDEHFHSASTEHLKMIEILEKMMQKLEKIT